MRRQCSATRPIALWQSALQQGIPRNRQRFTGQYADVTGLDYYNARYYDPVVGQFTVADTVQGNLQGMDPYTYVDGNPTTHTDPTGQRIDWGGGETSVVNWKTHTAVTTESQTSTWGQAVDSWGGGQVSTTCVYGCGGSQPWYNSTSSAFIGNYVNTHHAVQHAAPPAHKAPAQPKPKPKPAPTQSENLINKVASTVGSTIVGAADQFLGISSMVNDVQTLSGNGSWWDKTVAAGDLAMNAGMDISMLFGVVGASTMCNLEVAQDHTYTVGEGQWIVHNANCTVSELDLLHSPETLGRRPQLENLSDEELVDAVNNPEGNDPIKRVTSSASKITPDTIIHYEPYTPIGIPEPWE